MGDCWILLVELGSRLVFDMVIESTGFGGGNWQ